MPDLPDDFVAIAPGSTAQQLATAYGVSVTVIRTWCQISNITPLRREEDAERLAEFIANFGPCTARYINGEIASAYWRTPKPTRNQIRAVDRMRKRLRERTRIVRAPRVLAPPPPTAQTSGTRALIDDDRLGLIRIPFDAQVRKSLQAAAPKGFVWTTLPRFEEDACDI
jgi:hypothetical protein